jgi:hypothetical protein
MKRFWGHLIAVVGVTVGAAGLTSACAHDDSTIFVRMVIAPPASQGGGVCLYTADPSQPMINGGVLDVLLRSSYQPVFLVGNQMTPQENPDNDRTETSRVNLQGAIVRVTDVNGTDLRPAFTRSAAGTVDPAAGGTPSYSAFSVEILDSSVTDGLKAQLKGSRGSVRVMSYVKVFGHTLGGLRVESNEFQYPIDVCYGCLVIFPAGVDSNLPGFPQPNCANTGTGSATTASQPCVLGQDNDVDCRLCSGDPNPEIAAACGGVTTVSSDAGGGG